MLLEHLTKLVEYGLSSTRTDLGIIMLHVVYMPKTYIKSYPPCFGEKTISIQICWVAVFQYHCTNAFRYCKLQKLHILHIHYLTS